MAAGHAARPESAWVMYLNDYRKQHTNLAHMEVMKARCPCTCVSSSGPPCRGRYHALYQAVIVRGDEGPLPASREELHMCVCVCVPPCLPCRGKYCVL
jgi:hypothetical protein